MKEAAYKGMVRPILDYGSSVWDPHTDMLQEELEKVQNRAGRRRGRRRGLLVERRTPGREVGGSILTWVAVLYP